MALMRRGVNGEETEDEEWPFFPMRIAASMYNYDDSTYLTVDANRAYTLSRKMPPSCTCRKTGDTDDECTMFECTCICDLTAGACDYNCCCDDDCTQDEKERFENLNDCLPEGPVDDEITKCYTTKQVDKINAKFPMTAKGTAKSSVDRALCVRYDNSDLRGEFFDDPGYPDSLDIFDESQGQKNYDYPFWIEDEEIYSSDQSFDAGDFIPAAFAVTDLSSGGGIPLSDGYIDAFQGILPLPVPNNNGICSEAASVKFATPQSSTCIRLIQNLEAECASTLGSFRWSASLYLGTNGAASSSGSTDWIPVTIRSVKYTNFYDTTQTEHETFNDADVDCDATYGTSTSCLGTSSATANETCFNALVAVHYDIVHQSDGINSIVEAFADLLLTDIPQSANNDDNIIIIRQYYSVGFRSQAAIARSQANIVNRTRSGNPGYLFGRPLLAGANGNNDVIRPLADGLQLVAASGHGDCHDTISVPFGADTRTGCILRLNRTELRDFCNGVGDYSSTGDPGVPRYFNVSDIFGNPTIYDEYIGIFGNADPLDISQWLQITVKAPQNTAVWRERTGVCESAITSMNFRFLWSYVGAKDNPQPKIVAARLDFSKEDFAFTLSSTSALSQKISFPITFTATFIHYDEDAAQPYTPPAPPMAVSVPYDVWYPFKVESAATRGSRPTTLPFIIAALLLASFWFVSV
uniref:Tectonic domain-containing protein n=1 Tax=Aureoumbra lagunensis TaxID=44058 RepID=A0A7S3K434_9STRA|mmetsp:Transcript_20247/g.30889  ORF Transcript_20247/g.30889 Transcript_20247/m.30889 type:complete len:694 (+) Transcript_20247:2-2083(+)